MPSSASTPTQIYTLSLHDALPISCCRSQFQRWCCARLATGPTTLLSSPLSTSWHTPLVGILTNIADFCSPRMRLRSRCSIARPHSRSEEHTSELQSPYDLVCRLLLPHPPRSTLFPYTTLFRSHAAGPNSNDGAAHDWPRAQQLYSRVLYRRVGTRRWSGSLPISPTSALRECGCARGARSRGRIRDRKSTRLNSSHRTISYAVFCFHTHPDLHSFPTRRSSDLMLQVPIPTMVLRTTGHGPNNFTLESFIDELAHAAGRDPYQYRRLLLSENAAALAVLDRAAAFEIGRAHV